MLRGFLLGVVREDGTGTALIDKIELPSHLKYKMVPSHTAPGGLQTSKVPKNRASPPDDFGEDCAEALGTERQSHCCFTGFAAV